MPCFHVLCQKETEIYVSLPWMLLISSLFITDFPSFRVSLFIIQMTVSCIMHGKQREDPSWNVCIIISLYVHYCTICCLICICFVSFALCYVLILRFIVLLFCIFCSLFCMFCVSVLFCVLFLLMYRLVYFSTCLMTTATGWKPNCS